MIVNYALPHRCMSCSELTEEANGICAHCFKKLNFITSPYCNLCGFPFEFEITGQNLCGKCVSTPPIYDLGRSLFRFDSQSKKLIYAFKYNDQTSHAKMFAKLLLARYYSEIQDIDFIVSVPMHRIKRLFRNYNPAQILGEEISTLMSKPTIHDLLIKIKWTKTQTSLSKTQREKNLAGSLKINSKYNVKGKKILLVDDVRTTGTTSNNCSAILKKAGASVVKLVTIGAT